MTYPGKNPFFFWPVCPWLLLLYATYFCREKYISPHCGDRMVLSIELEAKNRFKNQLQDLFSSPFPFILLLFFFSDLESFFFFSYDAICINNGILLFDWLCALPQVALKCHAPSDDTFLATNKRCDAWGGQGVKTKTNLATVAWGDGLILFKMHLEGAVKKTLPKQRSAISSKTFFSKNKAHMKVKFCSTCCINWSLACKCTYVSNYSTQGNFLQEVEIWQ